MIAAMRSVVATGRRMKIRDGLMIGSGLACAPRSAGRFAPLQAKRDRAPGQACGANKRERSWLRLARGRPVALALAAVAALAALVGGAALTAGAAVAISARTLAGGSRGRLLPGMVDDHLHAFFQLVGAVD